MKEAVVLLTILSILLMGCNGEPAIQYTYRPPEDAGDGLAVGTLEEVGIDSARIEQAVSRILSGKYTEVHSLLIVKDDQLVLEEYFPGHDFQWDAPGYRGRLVTWDRDELHTVMSVGKSMTSASIGLAIDHGFIGSVHQSIFDYLPEHQRYRSAEKDTITIEHLLTMTSGLEWKEWGASNTSMDSDLFKLWVACEDQIACVLEKPLVHEPGTTFNYSGGGMNVLGEIVKNATNMDIEAFSGQYLFEPLGIDQPEWRRFESGVISASGEQIMTPRDMAKFGMLYLNNGVWSGKQIISEAWVEKSATPYAGNQGIKVPGEDTGRVGYSYSWWTKQLSRSGGRMDTFWADGWGGQRIVVVPELDTVVVFTGGNYASKVTAQSILEKYIFPAID
ncbi:MAG TPA: serine hydrolase [Anaerolineae bacterium]|nr:serine hydrolase [Anaerolineae bacterium]